MLPLSNLPALRNFLQKFYLLLGRHPGVDFVIVSVELQIHGGEQVSHALRREKYTLIFMVLLEYIYYIRYK